MYSNHSHKRFHWIWYVFLQLKGLGRSYNSEFYGISGLEEAKAYLGHPVLRQRLREGCEVILGLPTNDVREVFGGLDSRKLRLSMTLFDLVSPEDSFSFSQSAPGEAEVSRPFPSCKTFMVFMDYRTHPLYAICEKLPTG